MKGCAGVLGHRGGGEVIKWQIVQGSDSFAVFSLIFSHAIKHESTANHHLMGLLVAAARQFSGFCPLGEKEVLLEGTSVT
jgi:hypothetical protein